ncbi:nucleotidyltransferase family protein [Pseudooceanicola algae]|uniref:Purine catabolism protein PucB n=1 Tax=Pseudooceanicola algae TaxID=1537215 RepID=A0A418SF21_9RHOB|nr:nucleotidyltransferase family protein [Pseudooceanicola algae]QPM89802.1 Purine catabolism protein PucB [Pseudooceanicola algae]
MIAILLLAAGAARRMGGADKLLEQVEGQPLLRCIAQRALAADLGPVQITLTSDRPERDAALKGLPVQKINVPNAQDGMGASIACGIAALPEGLDGVMILPSDMPEITSADMLTLAEAFHRGEAPILRGASQVTEAGTAQSLAGHPVLFPADLFPDLKTISGDQGARALLATHSGRLRLVPLPGRHAMIDLDTPEDWARWRAEQA